MATEFSFTAEHFMQRLHAELQASITEAAEPIIQQALKDAEQRMRADLAANIIAMLRTDYDVFRDGRDLRIMVHFKEGHPNG